MQVPSPTRTHFSTHFCMLCRLHNTEVLQTYALAGRGLQQSGGPRNEGRAMSLPAPAEAVANLVVVGARKPPNDRAYSREPLCLDFALPPPLKSQDDRGNVLLSVLCRCDQGSIRRAQPTFVLQGTRGRSRSRRSRRSPAAISRPAVAKQWRTMWSRHCRTSAVHE